jgi:hypothetical protein
MNPIFIIGLVAYLAFGWFFWQIAKDFLKWDREDERLAISEEERKLAVSGRYLTYYLIFFYIVAGLMLLFAAIAISD